MEIISKSARKEIIGALRTRYQQASKGLCKINFQTAGVIQTYQREEDVRKMWSEKWLFFALLLLEGGGVYYFSAPDISDFIFEDNPNLFSRESLE